MLWHIDHWGVIDAWDPDSGYKSAIVPGGLFQNLAAIIALSPAHASAAPLHRTHPVPPQTPLRNLIGLLHSTGPHNDLAPIRLTLMHQISRPGLLLGAHQFAHGDLNLADRIVVATPIAIYHHKLVILHFLKVVCEGETGAEVGVERVQGLLSLANFDPGAAPLLKEHALGVRLAERVQIFQLAPADENFHLHLERLAHSCLTRLNHDLNYLNYLNFANKY